MGKQLSPYICVKQTVKPFIMKNLVNLSYLFIGRMAATFILGMVSWIVLSTLLNTI